MPSIRPSTRIVAAAGLAAALIAAGQTAASTAATVTRAGGPGHWLRVTPTGTPIIADLGLARGSDGILHVIWENGATTGQESIMDTPIAANGTASAAVVIAGHLDLATDPDATVTPSGLDAFWNGIQNSTPKSPTGTFQAIRPLSGGHWAPGPHIKPLPGVAYTSSSDSAGTASDGKPWVAFTGTDSLAAVHIGHPEVRIPPTKCCVYQVGLATDGSTGTTWLAYLSLITHHEGIFAQKLSATKGSGSPILLPGSETKGSVVTLNQRVGITGRGQGRGGVCAVYANGYPIPTALDLDQVGTSGKPVKLASFSGSGQLAGDTVTAAPGGQLWAAWFDGKGTPPALFVRMSAPSGTTFGKTAKVALPSGTSEVWKVYINAQASRLDVLALLNVNGSTAYWSTQVLPPG